MNCKWKRHLPLLKNLLVLFFILASQVACQKKCQPPETETFKTFTGTPWRLVETTDPSIKNLNNTTFAIFEFGPDYTGNIKMVSNNTQYDTPVFTFIYNVSLNGKREGYIRASYTKVTSPEQAEQATNSPADTSTLDSETNVISYYYELSRDFEMTETSHGYYYRFVPFKGIIEPDNECTF